MSLVQQAHHKQVCTLISCHVSHSSTLLSQAKQKKIQQKGYLTSGGGLQTGGIKPMKPSSQNRIPPWPGRHVSAAKSSHPVDKVQR